MSRVRVLVVDHVGAYWGAEQYYVQIAPALAERDVELVLAAPAGSPFAIAWSDAGLPARPLSLPAHHGLRREDGRRPGPVALAREGATVARSARTLATSARDVDVLHSNSQSAHVEVAIAGRLAHRPSVLDLHDLVRPGLGRRILTLAARTASVSIAWSRASADNVGGAARPDVELIPPGVDTERFAPGPPLPEVRRSLGGDGASHLVGILGRIDPIKRIDIAVRAMQQIGTSHPDARLVVIGAAHRGGEEYASSIRADAEARLGDRVVFTGARPDIPEVLRALDVVVSTNAAEPFGLSVLEAQSSGVPVIGSDAGGIPDFVEHDVTGLLVPPLDADALARALDRLLGDEALRRRLGEAGRSQSMDRYDVRRQIDARAAVYHQVARRVVTGPHRAT